MRSRILAVSAALPKPDMHSGDRRFVAFLEILARHHEVHLCVPLESPSGTRYASVSARRRRVNARLADSLPPPNAEENQHPPPAVRMEPLDGHSDVKLLRHRALRVPRHR